MHVLIRNQYKKFRSDSSEFWFCETFFDSSKFKVFFCLEQIKWWDLPIINQQIYFIFVQRWIESFALFWQYVLVFDVYITWPKQFKPCLALPVDGTYVVVCVLIHCGLFQLVHDLKCTQIINKRSLTWQLKLSEFKLGHNNVMGAKKNIYSVKSDRRNFAEFGLVLWHINHCRLFKFKFILHMNGSISNNSVQHKQSFFVYTQLNVKTVPFQGVSLRCNG